ncbi:MAG: hypothetical protein ACMV1K_00195 [Sulfurospirillum sp.]
MMESRSAGAILEVDKVSREIQVVRTNDRQKLHKADQIQELMEEIDEKINLFVSLTNSKGLAVKQRWRAIKKNAGIKQESRLHV